MSVVHGKGWGNFSKPKRGSTQRKVTNKLSNKYVFLGVRVFFIGFSIVFICFLWMCTREGSPNNTIQISLNPPGILPLSVFSVSTPAKGNFGKWTESLHPHPLSGGESTLKTCSKNRAKRSRTIGTHRKAQGKLMMLYVFLCSLFDFSWIVRL